MGKRSYWDVTGCAGSVCKGFILQVFCDPYSNTRLPSTAPASSAGLFHGCFLPSTTTKCTLSSFVWLLPLAEKNKLVFLVWLYPGGTVAWTLDTGSSCSRHPSCLLCCPAQGNPQPAGRKRQEPEKSSQPRALRTTVKFKGKALRKGELSCITRW